MTAFKKWLKENTAIRIRTTNKYGVIKVYSLAKKVAGMSQAEMTEMRTEFRKMLKEE